MPSTTASSRISPRIGASSGTRASSVPSPGTVPASRSRRLEPGLATRSRTSIVVMVMARSPPGEVLLLVVERRRLLGLVRRQLLVRGGAGCPQVLAPDLDLVQGLGECAVGGLGVLQDLPQGDLELRELGVDVVLRLPLHVSAALVGLGEDPLGLLLGAPGHLFLQGQTALLLARVLHDPLALGSRLRQQVLAI